MLDWNETIANTEAFTTKVFASGCFAEAGG